MKPITTLNFLPDDFILGAWIVNGPGRQWTGVAFKRREKWLLQAIDHRFQNDESPGEGDVITANTYKDDPNVNPLEKGMSESDRVQNGTNGLIMELVANGYGNDVDYIEVLGDVKKLCALVSKREGFHVELAEKHAIVKMGEDGDIVEFMDLDDEDVEKPEQPKHKPINRISGM